MNKSNYAIQDINAGHLPSSMEETEIEFLENSSTKLLPPETLEEPVFVLAVAFVWVKVDPVVVVHRPPRPWIPGLPGLGKVNESLESMRWTAFMSGLSGTDCWQHNNPSWMHIAASSLLNLVQLGSTNSNALPFWCSIHVCRRYQRRRRGTMNWSAWSNKQDEMDNGDSMHKNFKAIPERIQACHNCQRAFLFRKLKKDIFFLIGHKTFLISRSENLIKID